MKKEKFDLVLFFLLSFILWQGKGFSAVADDAVSSDFDVTGGVLVAYHGTGGDVVIPGNLGIVEIASSAFKNNMAITSVSIPEGVVAIDDSVFQACGNLHSLAIPASVTIIGEGSFTQCENLTDVFVNWADPTSDVTISGSVADVFSGSSHLANLYVPADPSDVIDTYTNNSDWADLFANIVAQTTNVTAVVLDKSVVYTSVGLTVQLTDTILPANSISRNVTWSSSDKNVATVSTKGLVTAVGNGTATISVTSTMDNSKTANCTVKITDFEVDDNHVLIGYHGAGGDVVIPDTLGISKIGDNVFSNNTAITSVTIPASVTSLGTGVFIWCNNLTAINADASNTNYSSVDGVLYSKDGKTLIDYPSGRNSLFIIPDAVTAISDSAFYSGQLNAVVIPVSVATIGDEAFAYCGYLKDINVYWSLESPEVVLVSDNAFDEVTTSGCGLHVPTGLTDRYKTDSVWGKFSTIDEQTDPTAVSLDKTETYLYIKRSFQLNATVEPANASEKNITWTSNSMIATVSSTGLVTAGSTVGTATIFATVKGTSIAASCTVHVDSTDFEVDDNHVLIAYLGVGGDVIIPDTLGISEIGQDVFANNATILSVTVPDAVKAIGGNAFGSCSNLTEINIGGGNPNYTSYEGVLYNKDLTTLIAYPAGKTDDSFSIVNSVSTIDNGAFINCNHLTSIIIPNSVKSIGDQAFSGCSHLTSLLIPNLVESIGKSAFSGCSSLPAIAIPNSVTSMGDNTFGWGCDHLTDMYVYWETPLNLSGTSGMFSGINISACTLHVPSGTQTDYAGADVWKDFHSMVVDVIGVSLDTTETGLSINETKQLTATISPDDATNPNISWSSSDGAIATVSASGLVTAINRGTATITVTTEDGGKTAACVVHALNIDADLDTLTVSQGTLTPAFSPSVTQYVASVSNGTPSVTLSATTNDSAATVAGTGMKYLSIGANNFDLVVTAEDGTTTKTYTVVVTRAPLSMSISPSSLNFVVAGEKKSLAITSNINWTVGSNASWLTFSAASGSNNGSVTVTADANPTITQRTATITITGTGVSPLTMTVTQDAADPVLSIAPDSLSFVAPGGQNTFTITTNTDWTIGSSASWLTVSLPSGSGNGTITVSAAANVDTTQRAAVITVSGTGVTKQTMNVTQDAAGIPLVVSDSTSRVGASGKGTFGLNLSIPSDATLTGSFEIHFPSNMTLDEQLTALSSELSGSFSLSYTYEGDNTWLIQINPSALKSSTVSTSYRKIMDIAYVVDDSTSNGNYKATIMNLNFLLNDNSTIKTDLLTVPIIVNRSATAIDPVHHSSFYAYSINNTLRIESANREMITIYSVAGVQLYAALKDAGTIEVPFTSLPGSVYIIKGSVSGTIRVVK